MKDTRYRYFYLFLWSCFVVFVMFWFMRYQRYDFSGEGYLWYGVQRVLEGSVPIRDFSAYDVGRYYWVAAFMKLMGGNGLMELRTAILSAQVVGLFLAIILVFPRYSQMSFIYLGLYSAVVGLWFLIISHHKAFDATLSILVVFIFAYLIALPVVKRYFITGIVIGIIAVFGRNHGLYAVIIGCAIFCYLLYKDPHKKENFQKIGVAFLGGCVGYAPVIFMAIFVPGFAYAMWESIVFLFEVKTTNLPLPIPYPWLVPLTSGINLMAIARVIVGCLFLLIVSLPIIVIVFAFYKKKNSQSINEVFIAAAFTGLIYAHYAYSRADLGHLAHGIFPMLIIIGLYFSQKIVAIKYLGITLMLLSSTVIIKYIHLPAYCYGSVPCVQVKVSGHNLNVMLPIAEQITFLRRLVDDYVKGDENILLVPHMPGAYPLLNKQSPMKDYFSLFPKTTREELREIERIKAFDPVVILVWDFALDGREELRFKNTHPLVHQFITTKYGVLRITSSNKDYVIYHRILP